MRFRFRVQMARIDIEPYFNPTHREVVWKRRQQNQPGVASSVVNDCE